jgi:hypothetical protein
MLAATAIAIFVIPMLFVLFERARGAREPHVESVPPAAPHRTGNGEPLPEAAHAPE